MNTSTKRSKRKSEIKWAALIFFAAIFVITNGCEKEPETIVYTEVVYVDTCCSIGSNDTIVSSDNFQIGDVFQGGIIFYIDPFGDFGSVCSFSNISSSAIWGCEGIEISGADDSNGSGYQNSIDILDGCPVSTNVHAASMTLSYVSGGFDDWYLPSIEELNRLYLHRDEMAGAGEAFDEIYWSSTEVNSNDAYGLDFSLDGSTETINKSEELKVRAVRTFFF